MSATVTLAELNPETLQDSDQTAEQQIQAAWRTCQSVERHGLEFGQVCYEWQQKFATKGGVGNKGRGIYPTLDKLNIPHSTAYYWIARYKESKGLTAPKADRPKTAKPVKEIKELADAIPPIRNGKEFTPPSQYSAADIVETVTGFTDNLVNQRHLPPSDRKTVYLSVIREFQDILAEMGSHENTCARPQV